MNSTTHPPLQEVHRNMTDRIHLRWLQEVSRGGSLPQPTVQPHDTLVRTLLAELAATQRRMAELTECLHASSPPARHHDTTEFIRLVDAVDSVTHPTPRTASETLSASVTLSDSTPHETTTTTTTTTPIELGGASSATRACTAARPMTSPQDPSLHDSSSSPSSPKRAIRSLKEMLAPGSRQQNDPPLSPRRVTEAALNWTRGEDNEARQLRTRLDTEGSLPEAALARLQALQSKEKGFLEGGVQNLNALTVLMVTLQHCVLPERHQRKGARLFAEVKLRQAGDPSSKKANLVTHSDPQKFTSKTVAPDTLDGRYNFDADDAGKLLLKDVANEVLRVSVFLSSIVKEKACSFDLRATDFVPQVWNKTTPCMEFTWC